MVYELIISEKPQAAAKIAEALSDGAPKKIRQNSVNFFSLTHKGKQIRVASAVGHLYILSEKGGESWKYPVFDTEWKPVYKMNKAVSYTKDYLKTLEELGKEADEITVASDFDVEGEVIGLNVVKYALKKKDANRMKFSTLTKDELIKSYQNKQNHLEWGQANAGVTRHTLDWYYGINLSRALTESIKKGTGQFKVLSAGRVQAPALHFLAGREKKIQAFKPEKFSEIYLDGVCDNIDIRAQYELPASKVKELKEENDEGEETKVIDKTKIFDEEFAKKVIEETTKRDGTIKEIHSKQYKQATPIPFDLTSLQMEANTMFGLTPKRTLEIAQKLYIEGITSYPRTSSQKLPKELDLKKVLEKLVAQPIYKDKVKKVLEINPSIKPKEGKKTDPAHPAIHPTGEVPKKLEGQDQKLYDLICKRFFAVFGEDAKRETNTIKVDINGHEFVLKGTRTIEKNWHELYEPYLKFEEIELPKLEKGKEVKNKNIEQKHKETSPPKRYTQASIIKELEKRNLGTKATRAAILDNLYSRGYVTDKSIKVTELGIKMDELLTEEMPIIVDEQLTREFEEEMEMIREEKSEPKKILTKAKNALLKVLEDVKKREKDIGVKLAGASREAQKELNKIGKCPVCEDGDMTVRHTKNKKRFAGCSNYPNCENTYPLPPKGKIEKVDNPCPHCKAPQVIILTPGKRPWRICINMNCPSKNNNNADKK